MTDRPAPSGNGKPPEPKPIINQVLQFKDGSRIRVIVEALINPDWDEATDAYYNMLVPVLDEMEELGAAGFMQSPDSD